MSPTGQVTYHNEVLEGLADLFVVTIVSGVERRGGNLAVPDRVIEQWVGQLDDDVVTITHVQLIHGQSPIVGIVEGHHQYDDWNRAGAYRYP